MVVVVVVVVVVCHRGNRFEHSAHAVKRLVKSLWSLDNRCVINCIMQLRNYLHLVDKCVDSCRCVLQVGTSLLTVTMVTTATRSVLLVQHSRTGRHSPPATSLAAALISLIALASTPKMVSI